jgi:hypothetical protein
MPAIEQLLITPVACQATFDYFPCLAQLLKSLDWDYKNNKKLPDATSPQ